MTEPFGIMWNGYRRHRAIQHLPPHIFSLQVALPCLDFAAPYAATRTALPRLFEPYLPAFLYTRVLLWLGEDISDTKVAAYLLPFTRGAPPLLPVARGVLFTIRALRSCLCLLGGF